jgi:hypothetical protein
LPAVLHLDQRRLLLPSRPRGDRPHHQVRRRAPELHFNYSTRYNEVWNGPICRSATVFRALSDAGGRRRGVVAARSWPDTTGRTSRAPQPAFRRIELDGLESPSLRRLHEMGGAAGPSDSRSRL